MKLINEWREAYKLKSIQSGALWAFFYVFMYVAFELLWLFGSNFPQLWVVIPEEIKQLLPHSWVLWLGFLNNVLSIFSRLKAQPELHPSPTILSFATVPKNSITFDDAFARLIGHEGGYSIDRNDPGNWTGGKVGIGKLLGTKFGIAANTYPNLDIKNLTLAQAKDIYKRDWWDKLGGSGLHSAITFQLWDFAVNAGIKRAVMELQQAVGVTVDGSIGPKTIAAVNSFDLNDVLLTLTSERLKFYTSLSTFSTYGKGWTNRVADNLKYAAKDN